MSLQINRVSGNTNGTPTASYYFSGLTVYGTAPATSAWVSDPNLAGFSTATFYGTADIAGNGILPYSGSDSVCVAPVGTVTYATAPTAGDSFPINITLPGANGTTSVINLGTYIAVSGDTTVTLLATHVAAMINAGTPTTGFSATTSSGEVIIAFPKYVGTSANSGTPIVATTTSGTTTITIAQPGSGGSTIAGVASQWAIWAYHIIQYFAGNPTGVLVIGCIASTTTFSEVTELQNVLIGGQPNSNGQLRVIGVYDTNATRGEAANVTAAINLLQTAANNQQQTAPFSVFYSPNTFSISDWGTYPSQTANTAIKVSSILSQDGNAAGALLFVQSGQSIGNIGIALGLASAGRISADWGQVTASNNLANGSASGILQAIGQPAGNNVNAENAMPAFSNGQLSSAVSAGKIAQLNNNRYIYTVTYGNTVQGTYFQENYCCTVSTNSYANINDNRVYDEISRICYATYLPQVKAEGLFNADGTLQTGVISQLQNLGEQAVTAALIQGQTTPYISGITIIIPAGQKPKLTNNLNISVSYNENGIFRNITINLGNS